MSPNNRYYTLDSLRGIACMQVVLGHCFAFLPLLTWMYEPTSTALPHDKIFYLAYSPLHVFIAGPKAVKLFFILSGFVLSLPLYKNDLTPLKYFNFFNRRILRLYLPCLAVILISLLVKQTFYNPPSGSKYTDLANLMNMDSSGRHFFNALILRDPVFNIDPVLWTLPPEIKLSLLLPFFIYIIRRINPIWSILAIFAMIFVNMGLKALGLYSILPDIGTLYYMTFFLIGAVVCKYRLAVIDWINNLNIVYFYSLLIITVYLYSFNYSMWWLPSKALRILTKYDDYVTAVPATLLLIFALSRNFESILNNRFFKFIGEISFSLYLTHFIVILSCIYLLANYTNEYIVIAMGFILSIPAAYLFYRFIEKPALGFSKYFADQLLVLVQKLKLRTQ